MTIYMPSLKEERLRFSDTKHSEILSKEHTSFALADGESEFTVEQIATTDHRSRLGWVIYLIWQILTALPRAIAFRKPIFVRCNPILFTARVKVNSFRFSDLTLFLEPGGYSLDVHSYQPPVLSGDKELSIQMVSYGLDPISVNSAIREEKMSKFGYYSAMFAVPIFLVILTYLTNYGIFFGVAVGVLPFMTAFTLMGISHSRRVHRRLQEKLTDTLRYLNGEM